ncbi:MAG: hypothetical protein ABL993_15255 [Vicinamibacterales bacterium]
MMDVLVWIEQSAFGTYMRESGSLWAFPMFLFTHTLGMSIVAGSATIINLALIGIWPRGTPIKPLERFYPLMWLGVWVSFFTGVSMFMKDASIYGRNPDFYVKLLFVIAGVTLLSVMRTRVFGDPRLDHGPVPVHAKRLAWVSMVCWFAAIVGGRLIAYLGPVAGL